MYCQKCGEKIIEVNGAKVCRRCGQSVEQEQNMNRASTQYNVSQQNQGSELNQRARVRQEETAELNKMIRYFSQKAAQYAEYDKISRKLSPEYRSGSTALMVFAIICGGIGFFLLVLSISEDYTRIIIVPALLFICGCVALIVMYVISSKNKRAEYEKNEARFEELSNELNRHYLNYGYCLVSAEYTNPENLKVVLQTIESGRADTIKEAINILVEDAHRTSMRSYAAQTAASSASAARSAKAAAVFSAANFFKKR